MWLYAIPPSVQHFKLQPLLICMFLGCFALKTKWLHSVYASVCVYMYVCLSTLISCFGAILPVSVIFWEKDKGLKAGTWQHRVTCPISPALLWELPEASCSLCATVAPLFPTRDDQAVVWRMGEALHLAWGNWVAMGTYSRGNRYSLNVWYHQNRWVGRGSDATISSNGKHSKPLLSDTSVSIWAGGCTNLPATGRVSVLLPPP